MLKISITFLLVELINEFRTHGSSAQPASRMAYRQLQAFAVKIKLQASYIPMVILSIGTEANFLPIPQRCHKFCRKLCLPKPIYLHHALEAMMAMPVIAEPDAFTFTFRAINVLQHSFYLRRLHDALLLFNKVQKKLAFCWLVCKAFLKFW